MGKDSKTEKDIEKGGREEDGNGRKLTCDYFLLSCRTCDGMKEDSSRGYFVQVGSGRL